jgi:tetratricopeptide (TPR) repeat protein
MTEQRRFPFGGIPVYNPQSLSKTEALAQFHVRQVTYQNLIDLLREERPSHVLIIGARGMGKSTLLQRVRYGVEDDPELHGRHLVLAFPEEQYNVNRLHHFLLNTVDALADAMERLKDDRMLARVETYADAVGKCTPEEIEERVPQFLAEIGQQMRKGFLFLVDNADRLFEMIDDRQQWRLRELLSSRRDLTFFGATTQASDGIYGPDRAFFEFFKVYRLAPLTLDEVRNLLIRLSESVEEKESEKGAAKQRVAEWLDADAARLRTLVQLTGGNPRTTVLLFHLVLDGLEGGAREYLEQLLDQVTPGYKGRVDELPPQAQQVLDAVALRWDPVTAMEVAEYAGLDTSAVSAQLTRLVRQGILEKADPGDSKKALYQVAERFFNIWYLMRASRRVRAKLRWFVEFLRVFFERSELEQMAWERIERYQNTWRGHPEEIETAFAYVLASGADRDRVEDYLRQKCADIEERWRPYLDLIECPMTERSAGERSAEARPGIAGDSQVETEAELRKAIDAEPENATHWGKLGRFLAQNQECAVEAEAAYRKAIELDPKFARFWFALGNLLAKSPERAAEAEAACRKAIELDPKSTWFWDVLGDLLAKTPERAAEAEAAYRKALELGPKFAVVWNDLGRLLAKSPERAAEAEAAYRKAIELDPKFAWFWDALGDLLATTPERAAEAEAAYRKAIELDPHAAAWNDLGNLLAKSPERASEAEAAYLKAIELDPKIACVWDNLGVLLANAPERTAEAEAIYRKAIELDPKDAKTWGNLGNLFAKTSERAAEAEAAYRKAIELDPKFAGVWSNLGSLLAKSPERASEAEAAYRKAIELDPKFAWFWDVLGDLLAKTPERAAEAEAAYRKAIELDPKFAVVWSDLGRLLAKSPERAVEAEAAYRKAIELDPHAAAWNDLGNVLAKTPKRAAEAEAAYLKAIELAPKIAGVWDNLGMLLTNAPERTAEAEAIYRKAIELDPKDAKTWGDLGNLFATTPERAAEAEAAYRKAIELDPKFAGVWNNLGSFLAKSPERAGEAETAYRAAIELDPKAAAPWGNLGIFLACRASRPKDAEVALRNSVQFGPNDPRDLRNLGVLLYCELGEPEEAAHHLGRAHQLDPGNPVSEAIFAASLRDLEISHQQVRISDDATREAGFWHALLELCQNYAPFGKILLGICDLVQEGDNSNRFARLYRAVALAQLCDFPRASVALEDALTGDPIELLSIGQKALETFFAAAVRNERVRDCLELIDKKDWKDAWRPIYEALRAVEAGSAEYLKRIAVEIRNPALLILRRIAPDLPDLPERTG